MLTATSLFELLYAECSVGAVHQTHIFRSMLATLGDGGALKSLGITDQDQEAVECLYDELMNHLDEIGG